MNLAMYYPSSKSMLWSFNYERLAMLKFAAYFLTFRTTSVNFCLETASSFSDVTPGTVSTH